MDSLCSPDTFNAAIVAGIDVTFLEANLVEKFTATAPSQLFYGHPTTAVDDVTFCNVTVTYTHTDANNEIHVESWLPIGNYNQRLHAVGGGGWVAGRYSPSYSAMAGAIAEGYATSTTDAGLLMLPYLGPDRWALNKDGEPNIQALRNLAYVSLGDQVSAPCPLTSETCHRTDYSSRQSSSKPLSRTSMASLPFTLTSAGAPKAVARA
jgi:hypothetical protein